MKKRKTYEVSVINKTYSKTYSDQTKFYTSDTALELNFQLKEVEYDFDSAEIILLNVDDRSLVTRPVTKSAEGFTYELEDDIVEHYGEWKGQLKFNEGGEIYVSSPVSFRIENDLGNDRPPQLTDIRDWETLRQSAKDLIAEMGDIAANEAARIEAEKQRNETVKNIKARQNSVETQFNSIQQELTDKDPISAPEIIAARGGEPTLSARLDKEQQEVTAQLAQTGSRIDNIIATAGDGTIPTELTDMRVKSDGSIAINAGQALRETQSGEALMSESVKFYNVKRNTSKVISVSGTTTGFQNSNAIGIIYQQAYEDLIGTGIDLTAVKVKVKMKILIEEKIGSGTISGGLKVLGATTTNDLLVSGSIGADLKSGLIPSRIYNFEAESPIRNYTGPLTYSLNLYPWITSSDNSTKIKYKILEHSFELAGRKLQHNGVTDALVGTVDKIYSESDEGGFYTKKEVDDILEQIAQAPQSRLSGKKIVALGDSMVAGHNLSQDKTWLYKLANRNNMLFVNYGINGTFMSSRLYNGKAGAVERFTTMDDDADYIVIFAGTNDAANSVAMGDDNSTDISTFKGALNVLCSGLITKYPTKRICFITPYLRGGLYPQYITAIETICAKYGIPVFNNSKNGGIDWTNTAQKNALTLNDTYHLNESGMEYASYKYESFIQTL